MSEPILNQYYICSGLNQSWTNSQPILWLDPFGHRSLMVHIHTYASVHILGQQNRSWIKNACSDYCASRSAFPPLTLPSPYWTYPQIFTKCSIAVHIADLPLKFPSLNLCIIDGWTKPITEPAEGREGSRPADHHMVVLWRRGPLVQISSLVCSTFTTDPVS